MLLNFRHGVIFGERFIRRNGYNVDLINNGTPLCVTIADGDNNYLHFEAVNVQNAWKFDSSVKKAYLYIDISRKKGDRTFGSTLTAPVYGATAPTNPKDKDHWFNTTTSMMYYFNAPTNSWFDVIRLFVGEYTTGQQLYEYKHGSTVGITASTSKFVTSALIFNEKGNPIRSSNGKFATTDINKTISTRSVVGVSQDPISKGTVVTIKNGEFVRATYSDVGSTILGVLITDSVNIRPTYATFSGIVNNASWNWSVPPGSKLWVNDQGILTTIDPKATKYLESVKVPVAFVLDGQTIYFTQELKSASLKGSDIAQDHSHGSTDILIIPSIRDQSNVNDLLVEIDLNKLDRAGGEMIGALNVLTPTNSNEPAPKDYVDGKTLDGLVDVVITNPTADQSLSWNGTHWVNVDPVGREIQEGYRDIEVTQSVIDDGVVVDLAVERLVVLHIDDDTIFSNVNNANRIGLIDVDFINISLTNTTQFSVIVEHQLIYWAQFHFTDAIQWEGGQLPNIQPPSTSVHLVMNFKIVPRTQGDPLIVGRWRWHLNPQP